MPYFPDQTVAPPQPTWFETLGGLLAGLGPQFNRGPMRLGGQPPPPVVPGDPTLDMQPPSGRRETPRSDTGGRGLFAGLFGGGQPSGYSSEEMQNALREQQRYWNQFPIAPMWGRGAGTILPGIANFGSGFMGAQTAGQVERNARENERIRREAAEGASRATTFEELMRALTGGGPDERRIAVAAQASLMQEEERRRRAMERYREMEEEDRRRTAQPPPTTGGATGVVTGLPDITGAAGNDLRRWFEEGREENRALPLPETGGGPGAAGALDAFRTAGPPPTTLSDSGRERTLQTLDPLGLASGAIGTLRTRYPNLMRQDSPMSMPRNIQVPPWLSGVLNATPMGLPNALSNAGRALERVDEAERAARPPPTTAPGQAGGMLLPVNAAALTSLASQTAQPPPAAGQTIDFGGSGLTPEGQPVTTLTPGQALPPPTTAPMTGNQAADAGAEARRVLNMLRAGVITPQEAQLRLGLIRRGTDEVVSEAAAKERGEQLGRSQAALPSALRSAGSFIQNIDALIADPTLRELVGYSPYNPAARLPNRPHQQATAARIEQVQGQAFLAAYEALRGSGNITEVEGAQARAAIARLGNLGQTHQDYIAALNDARREVWSLMNLARTRAGQQPIPYQPHQSDARGRTDQPDAEGWITLPNGVRIRERP